MKKNKLKACLESGIRSAYNTGLTKELKKKNQESHQENVVSYFVPKKDHQVINNCRDPGTRSDKRCK